MTAAICNLKKIGFAVPAAFSLHSEVGGASEADPGRKLGPKKSVKELTQLTLRCGCLRCIGRARASLVGDHEFGSHPSQSQINDL